MRLGVVLAVGLVTLALAGCGGGSGFIRGTVDDKVADTMHVGMSESTVKSDLHGEPLDQLPYYAGECVFYRGVIERSRHHFYATGNEWELCFHHNKLALLLRTCGVSWKLDELDRYKKAGYSYNTAPYHGNPSDCRH